MTNKASNNKKASSQENESSQSLWNWKGISIGIGLVLGISLIICLLFRTCILSSIFFHWACCIGILILAILFILFVIDFFENFKEVHWRLAVGSGVLGGLILGIFLTICLLYHTSMTSNIMFDIALGVVTIILLIYIIHIFRNSYIKCSPWVPVTFMISILVIFIFGVIYKPIIETFPITKFKLNICDCEICFTQKLQEEGRSFCELQKQPTHFVMENSNLICFFPHNWKSSCLIKQSLENISSDDLLQLCCSSNTDGFVKNLAKIKSEYLSKNLSQLDLIPEETKKLIIKILLLDGMVIDTLQKSISSCSCKKSDKCNSCSSSCNCKNPDNCNRCSSTYCSQ